MFGYSEVFPKKKNNFLNLFCGEGQMRARSGPFRQRLVLVVIKHLWTGRSAPPISLILADSSGLLPPFRRLVASRPPHKKNFRSGR